MKGPIGARNRVAAAATIGAGLVAVVASWALVGDEGPLSALLGLVLVLAFFGAGSLPFAVAEVGRGFALLVLGMTYVLRILLGVVVYVVVSEASWVDNEVVGLTVIGCALVWTNTQLVLGLRRRGQPTLDV